MIRAALAQHSSHDRNGTSHFPRLNEDLTTRGADSARLLFAVISEEEES